LKFQRKFDFWPETASVLRIRTEYSGKIAVEKETKIDVATLFEVTPTDQPLPTVPGTDLTQLPNPQFPKSPSIFSDLFLDVTKTDESLGNAEVWILEKIVGPTFTKLQPEEKGVFYSEDTYMVLNTFYDDKDEQKYVAYFWEGQDAAPKVEKVP
jgi:hypothetical protein